MKNLIKRATVAATFAAAGTLALAPSALAAGGVVTVGGNSTTGTVAITATSVGNFTFATNWGVPTTCTTATVTGEVYRGTAVVVGNTMGAIKTLTFSGCTATTLNYPVVVEKKAGTGNWNLVVASTPTTKGGPVALTVTGVNAQLHSTGATPYNCELGAAGNVPGTFTPATQRLSISSTAFPLALTAYNGSGGKVPTSGGTCGGQIYTGDTANMTGSFAVSTGSAGPITH